MRWLYSHPSKFLKHFPELMKHFGGQAFPNTSAHYVVESRTKKVQALGRAAARKISRRRAKVAGASVARKVKPAVVKPAMLTNPSESAPQSGAA